jgi:hypothetical protein
MRHDISKGEVGIAPAFCSEGPYFDFYLAREQAATDLRMTPQKHYYF